MSDPWDGLLSAEEREVWSRFVGRKSLGRRPALLIVDVTYAFVGGRAEPIGRSVREYRTSCGDGGWRAVEQIAPLLAVARANGVPVFYTTNITHPYRRRQWADRMRDDARELANEDELGQRRRGNEIVPEIAPRSGDVVIEKSGASAFFGTSLAASLNALDIDTVIVTGGTTSGCVRATAVDAACSSYYVGVVTECVFDRFDISHRVSLMDMAAKYGMLLSRDAAEAYLGGDGLTRPAEASPAEDRPASGPRVARR